MHLCQRRATEAIAAGAQIDEPEQGFAGRGFVE